MVGPRLTITAVRAVVVAAGLLVSLPTGRAEAQIDGNCNVQLKDSYNNAVTIICGRGGRGIGGVFDWLFGGGPFDDPPVTLQAVVEGAKPGTRRITVILRNLSRDFRAEVVPCHLAITDDQGYSYQPDRFAMFDYCVAHQSAPPGGAVRFDYISERPIRREAETLYFAIRGVWVFAIQGADFMPLGDVSWQLGLRQPPPVPLAKPASLHE